MAGAENAVLTKTRAIFGRMLSPTQYDELLRRQSVQEIAAYLKEKTSYAAALAEVQESTVHRGQLENLLRRDCFYQFVRLGRYVPRRTGIYAYIVLDMEIDGILACLRDIITVAEHAAEYVAGLPTFVQPFACFDLLALGRVKTFAQLREVLAGTPYAAVLAQCAEGQPDGGIDYPVCERALRRWYYETLLAQARRDAHGDARAELEELITARAEATNLHTIYRLKAFFAGEPEQIRRALLPFRCKLTARQLEGLVQARDAAEFMQRLAATGYGRSIPADADFIENATGNIRYRRQRRLLRFSTSPQVAFTAFMLLRGMEVENIVRIIEGVRYQMPPEHIGRLLYHA